MNLAQRRSVWKLAEKYRRRESNDCGTRSELDNLPLSGLNVEGDNVIVAPSSE